MRPLLAAVAVADRLTLSSFQSLPVPAGALYFPPASRRIYIQHRKTCCSIGATTKLSECREGDRIEFALSQAIKRVTDLNIGCNSQFPMASKVGRRTASCYLTSSFSKLDGLVNKYPEAPTALVAGTRAWQERREVF